MTSLIRRVLISTALCATAIHLAIGCSSGVVQDPAPQKSDVAVGDVEQWLGSGDGCPTTAADATINGTGSVTSSRSYDHSSCFQGYLVDINNYDPSNAGSLAYYAEATEPTTPTECTNTQMRVYVWKRNADGTTKFLGGTFPKGQWVTNRLGQQGCIVPRVNVEGITGFSPDGGNYRVGMRAQDLGATGDQRRRIYFETVKRRDLTALRALLRQEIASAPAGTVIPRVHSGFAAAASGAAQMQCNTLLLTRSLYDYTRPSFIKAGASAASMDAVHNAVDSMYGALCAPGGTESELQRQLKAYLDANDQIQRDIAAAIGTTVSGGTPPMDVALNIMANIVAVDVGRLTANCGLTPPAISTFLFDGTLPTGVSADRLLMGTCSGTPAQIAARLGVGGPLASSTLRSRLKACLTPPDLIGNAHDICNDPRAAGAESEAKDGLKEGECRHVGTNAPCTDAEKKADQATFKAQQDEDAAIAARIAQFNRDQAIFNQGVEAGKKQAADELRRQQEESKPSKLESFVEYFIDFNLKTGTAVLKLIEQVSGVKIVDPCPSGPGKCQAYCAADFATGGYYGSQLDFNYGPSRELNQQDLASHCLCKVMEEEYAARTGIAVGLSSACPSLENQKQLECLANPFGPDDKPRPECVRDLLPGDIDQTSWRARICNAVRCPDSTQVPALDASNACECIVKPRVIGSTTPGCRTNQLVYCSSEGFGNCDQCQPTNNGVIPYGNDPTCRLDPTGWPGSLDAVLRSNATAVTLHQLGSENFLMLNARVVAAPSFVTTTYNREAFANLGTIVRQRTLISSAPATGQNLDLQLYCTNYGNRLIHNFMGQCRLNSQTPGTPGSCDITLNPSTRDACLGGSFNFEYVSQSPAAYQGKIGAGPWTFAGTLTPPSTVNPVCPAPDPLSIFPQTNPVWTLAGGTPTNPNPIFELASGTGLRIPPGLFLPLRPIE